MPSVGVLLPMQERERSLRDSVERTKKSQLGGSSHVLNDFMFSRLEASHSASVKTDDSPTSLVSKGEGKSSRKAILAFNQLQEHKSEAPPAQTEQRQGFVVPEKIFSESSIPEKIQPIEQIQDSISEKKSEAFELCFPGNGDDDSSAALDAFLDSKLKSLLHGDDDRRHTTKIQPPESRNAQSDQSRASPEEEPPSTIFVDNTKFETPEFQTPKPPTHRKRLVRNSMTSAFRSAFQDLRPSKSPLYNPLTGYSPNRPIRRQVMGMSIFENRPTSFDDDDVQEEDSSVDSEELLELCATQIRAELRHAEMVELALEAERAAEAGEERFAARTFTYRTESEMAIRRNASYSEGVAPKRRRAPYSAYRIPIQDLRNVEEVLPSFEIFHKNLRTHLARNDVSERCLLFAEQEELEMTQLRPYPQHSLVQEVPDVGCREGQNSFLDSFSFDLLVSGTGSDNDEKKQDCSTGVADFLADHLVQSCGRRRIPKRESLPGMEDIEMLEMAEHRKSGVWANVCGKDQLYDEVSLGKNSSFTEARALFEDDSHVSDVDSIDELIETNILKPKEQSLVTPSNNRQKSPDFITPARLRKIRGTDSNSFETDEANLQREIILRTNSVLQGDDILRTNSVIQESPLPNSVQERFHLRPEPQKVVLRDLLLPALPKMEDTGSTSHIRPLVSRVRSDVGSPSYSMDLAISRSVEHASLPNDEVRPTSPACLSDQGLVEGRNRILGRKLLRRRREVPQVAIPAGSPVEVIASKSQEKDNDANSLNSNGSAVGDALALDGSNEKAMTPLHDCNCLTLSPASSDEVGMDFPGNPSRVASSSANSPKAFEAAMNMLSNLSNSSKCRAPSDHRKSLYVSVPENDDFVQNFLYCGKRKEEPPSPLPQYNTSRFNSQNRILELYAGCSEQPCQAEHCDSRAVMDRCCVALVLDEHNGHRDSLSHSSIVPNSILRPYRRSSALFRDTTPKKADKETWFDVATEKVDSVFESLVGPVQQNQWNVIFEPPSLRKNAEAAQDRWTRRTPSPLASTVIASPLSSPESVGHRRRHNRENESKQSDPLSPFAKPDIFASPQSRDGLSQKRTQPHYRLTPNESKRRIPLSSSFDNVDRTDWDSLDLNKSF